MNWGTRNRMIRYAGDVKIVGSEVVGSAGKPGNKTEIQHIGQNGVYKDGCLCRGLMKSMAEEGSSSIELSQQCSETSLEFCG